MPHTDKVISRYLCILCPTGLYYNVVG